MVRSGPKLFLILLSVISGIILFIAGSFLMKLRIIEVISKPSQISTSTAENEKSITIILTGDIMLDRGVEYMVEKYGEGNFKFPFLKIADTLQEADIVFGNLEGPISDKGTKVGSIYSFRTEPKVIEGLKFAGFNVLSLANNHAFDYGRMALEDTLKRLKETGVDEHSFISTLRSARVIDYVGAGFDESEAYSPVVKEINGSTSSPLRVGFLAYTNLGSPYWTATASSSGIAWLTEEKLKEGIKLAKEKADIVIVSFHLGEEYQAEPNYDQKYFSHLAIEAGADLAIGHHPHVIQQYEIYKEKYIFYSLGNFVFDQGFSEETMKGQMVKILIENGEIKEVLPINIKINDYFQPEIIK